MVNTTFLVEKQKGGDVGVSWAAGGLDDLDGLELCPSANYFVHLWLKNRRKGQKNRMGNSNSLLSVKVE